MQPGRLGVIILPGRIQKWPCEEKAAETGMTWSSICCVMDQQLRSGMKRGMKVLLSVMLAVTGAFGALTVTASQEKSADQSDEILKKLTPEEQAALNKSGDSANDRVKSYLRIASARLKNARTLLDADKDAEADEQIAIYTALVEDAGRFLSSVKPRDKSHKTMEQGLKGQLRLLEGFRRDTPATHFDVADEAVKLCERVRIQALKSALAAEDLLKTPGQT